MMMAAVAVLSALFLTDNRWRCKGLSLEEYSIGDQVSYVFLVDFNRKGEETLFNDTTTVSRFIGAAFK